LQHQQQQCGESEDDVNFIERVLFAPIKRSPGTRQQVGHPESDDN
jgi:hypothetical protein